MPFSEDERPTRTAANPPDLGYEPIWWEEDGELNLGHTWPEGRGVQAQEGFGVCRYRLL